MLLSLSAKIKKDGYAWYKFQGKRKAVFDNHHSRFDMEIESGEVFGLKPVKNGESYFLIDRDADARFKLSTKEAQSLVRRSRVFTGKIPGVRETIRGPRGGKDSAQRLNPSQGAPASVELSVDSLRHPRENYDLTKKLQSVKIGGAKKIKFIQAREMVPGEYYYYYDAVSTLRSYRRKHRIKVGQYGNWAKDTERAVEKSIRGIDVELGTARMNGEVKHLLVVVDL